VSFLCLGSLKGIGGTEAVRLCERTLRLFDITTAVSGGVVGVVLVVLSHLLITTEVAGVVVHVVGLLAVAFTTAAAAAAKVLVVIQVVLVDLSQVVGGGVGAGTDLRRSKAASISVCRESSCSNPRRLMEIPQLVGNLRSVSPK
jgi:hypothetical protein